MSEITVVTKSLRSTRLAASLPRMLAVALVLVLCLTGLHTILASPEPSTVVRRAAAAGGDQAAESFAQAFARAYLTWRASDTTGEARERALAPFINTTLDTDGGLTPRRGSSQHVSWTAVVGEHTVTDRRLVTVAVGIGNGVTYLNVPVERDKRGFLSIAGYPAIVGAPPTNPNGQAPSEDEVQDAGLTQVVGRAVTNYLAGNRANLLSDLTPDAVISLPGQRLRVTGTPTVTWVVPRRRVAVQVESVDRHKNTWTLRYELDVRHRDRWYVQSLQVDPTFRGGS